MKKMNIPLMATLLALSIIVCPVLYFTVGPALGYYCRLQRRFLLYCWRTYRQ